MAAAAALAAGAVAFDLHGTPACSGVLSGIAPWAGNLTLVAEVPNGRRLAAGVANASLTHVVQVWGTPFQQGFAQGQLFQKARDRAAAIAGCVAVGSGRR